MLSILDLKAITLTTAKFKPYLNSRNYAINTLKTSLCTDISNKTFVFFLVLIKRVKSVKPDLVSLNSTIISSSYLILNSIHGLVYLKIILIC